MASTRDRRALAPRTAQAQALSGAMSRLSRSFQLPVKRTRSPDAAAERNGSQVKKQRPMDLSAQIILRDREREREQARKEKEARDQQKQEFKEKYSRAFPSWSFYFDLENIALKSSYVSALKGRISQLGGRIDDFFSKDVTHVITDQPIRPSDAAKENRPSSKGSTSKLKSPLQLKSKSFEETKNDIVAKALAYNLKIWNAHKLDSVLCRCLDAPSVTAVQPKAPSAPPTQKLERLLSKEKTSNPTIRDPSRKYHDFRYFSKGSYFVLVEDIRGEVATIAAHEYVPPKDNKGKFPWPILYCHPHARGPFQPFDEKEKMRYERALKKKLEGDKAEESPEEKVLQLTRAKTTRSKFSLGKEGGVPDLRRSVSLNNLKKRHLVESPERLEGDGEGDTSFLESANASGFINSAAYMAASGNSVGITSTTGTTSTAGGLRHAQLPASMEVAMKRQVITSKKVVPTVQTSTSKLGERRLGTMEPPSSIPTKQQAFGMLKKAKSMQTFKQPKREEGSKPGYCECCRVKFECFKQHCLSTKHRRFAQNDDNFLGLDQIINRLQRRPLTDVRREQQMRVEQCRRRCSGVHSSGSSQLIFPADSTP